MTETTPPLSEVKTRLSEPGRRVHDQHERVTVIRPLTEMALRVGKPLAGPLTGCFGARRGTYRIVYRVDVDRCSVQVLDVDRRANVYRRR